MTGAGFGHWQEKSDKKSLNIVSGLKIDGCMHPLPKLTCAVAPEAPALTRAQGINKVDKFFIIFPKVTSKSLVENLPHAERVAMKRC